jgi:hypothetical protein
MRKWNARLMGGLGIALTGATVALAQGPPLFEIHMPDRHDRSAPLEELLRRARPLVESPRELRIKEIPIESGNAGAAADPTQKPPLSYASTVVGGGFEGLGSGFPGFTVRYAPPDTNAAVGSTQVVQWVNASYAVFNKDGSVALNPFQGNVPWVGFGGGCEQNDGDPIIQYDKLAGRWIFTQFAVSAKPYLQCFAVSNSDVISASTTFTRFAYNFGNTNFPDYPKLGVWPDGYYLSFNIFKAGAVYSGPQACALDRSTILAGGTPTMICVQLSKSIGSLLPADLDGSTQPPANSPNYFITYATNSLRVYKFRPNYGSPSSSSFTGPTTLSVAAFTRACSAGACVPQPGTSQKLDALSDRLMYRFAYRNNGGTESLVVNHSIKPATGTALSTVRWYELRLSSGNPSVYQTGTLDSSDGTSRWMGSIAMDKCGSIAVGYSASNGASVYPSIRTTARASSDPAGATQLETNIIAGSGSQTVNLSRWGDYSSLALDPVDDKTFWYTTEYMGANGTFNWRTRLAKFTVGTCN